MVVAAEVGRGLKRAAGKVLALLLVGATLLPADTFYVTVAGIGGEPEYEQRFTTWAKEIDKILTSSSPEAKVDTLYGSAATRAKLQSVMARIAKEAKPQDSLVLMLIGHGSFDGVEYKMNLPGPDLSAVELAGLLDRVPAEKQLVINMTSASGGSATALRKGNRALITATKSGTEKNAPVFPRFLVEALRDPAVDTDKNEVVSALEVFRYVEQKTAKFYESQKRLSTEHPTLEDTGKGEGVKKPSAENGQGLLAARFALFRMGSAQLAANNPEKQKLLKRKEELEQQIDELKYQKSALPSDQYRKQISDMLLQLAKTQAELDQ